MKALPTTCIVGLVAFTGIYLAGGNGPVATLPDAMPEAAANVVAPAIYAEASAKLAAALQAASAAVPSADSGTSTARAEIADDSTGPKLASLGDQVTAQPPPAARDASNDAAKPAPVAQNFRYLIYYVWSELPPAQKPAEIVLRSFKDIPVGTPAEEIKRASDAF